MAKVLVVDDDPVMLEACQQLFLVEGYQVLGAGDGLKGLEAARKERPDLMVLDLMLPKLDGFEVCQMLKSDEKFQSIKIILFTARKDDEVIRTSKESGADAYLTKGCDPRQILEVSRRLLTGAKID